MMKCDELKAFNMPRYAGEFTMHEVYLKSDVDSAIDELKSAHHKERHEYIKMVAELKEERRWRKFPDEKPEKWQKVLFRAKYKTDNIRTWIGEFRNVDFDVFYASAPGWGCEFLPNEIFGWMPLPSAPKEDK
jgi:hypothetical protein